jgi:hypothetical protein
VDLGREAAEASVSMDGVAMDVGYVFLTAVAFVVAIGVCHGLLGLVECAAEKVAASINRWARGKPKDDGWGE